MNSILHDLPPPPPPPPPECRVIRYAMFGPGIFNTVSEYERWKALSFWDKLFYRSNK